MPTVIEVVCSVSQEEAVRATVEAFGRETGNLLIGRRVYRETHQVLLVVELMHAASASKLTTLLSHARQQEVIASFRYVTYDLVKISFDPSVNLQEQMGDFPLRPGEWWFPAIHEPHQAYVPLSRPLMSAKQAAWLRSGGRRPFQPGRGC